jgi:hypothetical protein
MISPPLVVIDDFDDADNFARMVPPDLQDEPPLLVQPDRMLESTVKYLGIEVDDTLEMAERTEV